MIPNHKLASEYVEAEFLYENSEDPLIDIQPGGVAIGDNSRGVDYQMWEMTYENNRLTVRSLTTNTTVVLKNNVIGVTSLSFSFTLNMDINYTYTIGDTTYLYYFDSTIQQNTETSFINMRDVNMIYDDLRQTQTSSTDILLVYVNTVTGKLCYRLLRDRYTIEYELSDLPRNAKLIRVGMATNLRLKFKIQRF